MIKFTNVFKAYPKGGLALKDVSFHIAKGEFGFLSLGRFKAAPSPSV